MKTNKIFDVSFQGDNTIICCEMVNDREAVILMGNGHVISWNFEERTGNYLFSTISNNTSFRDGGFDIGSACRLYVLDEIVVAVNEFKAHGYAYNRKLGKKVHLRRELYHAEHSSYPIALFKNEDNVPHIIYAVAWNHVQVMNLETLQILTADKSLIEVGAEEKYRAYGEKKENPNHLPWPRNYDYFFAQLSLSPDNKYFMSRGWDWGSYDSYKVYNLSHFINDKKILDKYACGGEHYNRSACWVSNSVIAVARNEGLEDGIINSPSSLCLRDVINDDNNSEECFELDVFDGCCGEMFYSKSLNALVIYNDRKGLTICNTKGEILHREEHAKVHSFNAEHNLLVTIGGNAAFVYKIEA
jgi:hypothetical protein